MQNKRHEKKTQRKGAKKRRKKKSENKTRKKDGKKRCKKEVRLGSVGLGQFRLGQVRLGWLGWVQVRLGLSVQHSNDQLVPHFRNSDILTQLNAWTSFLAYSFPILILIYLIFKFFIFLCGPCDNFDFQLCSNHVQIYDEGCVILIVSHSKSYFD